MSEVLITRTCDPQAHAEKLATGFWHTAVALDATASQSEEWGCVGSRMLARLDFERGINASDPTVGDAFVWCGTTWTS